MQLTELFLAELDREVARSRRALDRVPEGKHDWKPHEKSMLFGYLANLVATMPSWVSMIIDLDEFDIAPKGGPPPAAPQPTTSRALVEALDKAAAGARASLAKTTDAHLLTRWKLLAAGHDAWTGPRHEIIRDTINHWSHHRGQMTVYLRLLGAPVPAIYGPSADDKSFA